MNCGVRKVIMVGFTHVSYINEVFIICSLCPGGRSLFDTVGPNDTTITVGLDPRLKKVFRRSRPIHTIPVSHCFGQSVHSILFVFVPGSVHTLHTFQGLLTVSQGSTVIGIAREFSSQTARFDFDPSLFPIKMPPFFGRSSIYHSLLSNLPVSPDQHGILLRFSPL